MKKKRIILISALIGILVFYLVSFGLFIKVPQVMTSLGSVGGEPPHVPAMVIYASTNRTVNRIGKIVYFPLVRVGEAWEWWLFADDASTCDGGPCLLLCLLKQPW